MPRRLPWHRALRVLSKGRKGRLVKALVEAAWRLDEWLTVVRSLRGK